MMSENIHASCVVLNGHGILIRGKSGSGKSDLVLRLLDESEKNQLVADDQTFLTVINGTVLASPPLNLAGKFEIRGQGIVERPYVTSIKIDLVIDMVEAPEIERMPDDSDMRVKLCGIDVPRLKLLGNANSAPARIRAFLRQIGS
jgi:HPr kinase/phosphorylase